MLNKSYHVRARKMGPIGMESAGQILGRLALGALAENVGRRARSRTKRKERPGQLELFGPLMNCEESTKTVTAAPPADRPLTEEELWQEFNRLFPDNQCPR